MGKLELVVESGALAGRRFPVSDGGLRLGRSSSNDIHVADAQLSRNHCLFERTDGGVRITDLASANGTSVNGRLLEGDPVLLKDGDVIRAGSLVIRAVDPEAAAAAETGTVDLGLGAHPSAPPGEAQPAAKRRPPLVRALWALAIVVSLAAIALVLLAPSFEEEGAPAAISEALPKLSELTYEKVEADLEGIFRYEMSVSAEGVIRVSIDDTRENRHPVVPPRRLDARALAELNEIVDFRTLARLDREYVGAEPEPPALNSWRLTAVYADSAKTVRIVNAQEPEAFKTLREKLEAFSKNELGIHAIQYPRAKLVSLAEEAIALGRTKWEDRDVQHGNLAASIVAFREAVFYLETVDPKPACITEARLGLERSVAELTRRYGDQRFRADRAINLGHWDEAQGELRILLEMIPDRTDDRHREATAKLLDVEKRMKGGQK